MKRTYQVTGMHCKSCEILIEEELSKKEGVVKAEVNLSKNQLTVESNRKIKAEELNKWFKKNNYNFDENSENKKKGSKWWWLPAVIMVGLFWLIGRWGWISFIDINSKTSWIVLLIFGVVAGFSSCGALLSGIIISYKEDRGKILIGRIISYVILGGLLGFLGKRIEMGRWMNILMILVSLVMIIVALQMLGVRWVSNLKTAIPKKWSKKIINQKIPWGIGLLTVFLPCGFTLLAEGSAVLSGSIMKGITIMLMFVLGSSIPLWLIGAGSEKIIKNQKTVGLLVLFFVFYNLWFQVKPNFVGSEEIEKMVKSEEIETVKTIKLTYGQFGLNPYQVTLKKGEKVRLEIEVLVNEYGCMSTILLPEMFTKPQTLIKGKTLVMVFTPKKIGIYKFVCAMGVPHKGEINVVE